LDLVWNFVTTAGVMTQTAVTPTDTAGNYDWVNQGNGMYSIEIPASGGASINNDTEGFGWFTGYATGILPWTGPVIGFRAAGLNNVLIDTAYSTTRGLAGTALPDAAAEAAGGLYTRGTGAGQLSQTANGELGVATLAKTLTTYTGDTPQTGDAFARIGANGAGLTAIDLPNQTMDITGNITGNIIGSLSGSVGSVTGAVGSVAGLTASNLDASISSLAATLATILGHVDTEIATLVTAAQTLTASERNAIADAIAARTLGTESYAADGAVPTFAQAFFELLSLLGEFSISGTTITHKKRDGSTSAFTATLDSSSSPTSRTRAT
jgi:hypothetical protein